MQNTSPFLIYNASAGSGKTFTLTVDYLSILFAAKDPFAFQRILAVTFTNKAVGEMKSRVLEHLIAFTQDEISENKQALYQQVKAKTQLSSEAIAEKSKQLLRQVLANYASFEISTIDSFTQRIIRTFAKDLGLSSNFEIELETEALLEEAVDRVMDQVGEDQQLTQILVDFALEKTEDDKSGNISLDVIEAAKLLLKDTDSDPIEALRKISLPAFTEYKKQIKAKEQAALSKLVEIGYEFFQLINARDIKLKSFKGEYIPTYFEKLINGNLSVSFETQWAKNIETSNLYNKSTTESQKPLIDDIQPKIAELFTTSKKLVYNYLYFDKVENYITQLSLLNVVQKELDTLKSERNLMLISDFNKTISQQIKQQPAPFIYERLGERFQHYFIDEFQDTSTLQWGNLIPLTEEALAKEHPVFGKGSLSLIGDAKQSIYAWRGGEAQQLIDLSLGISPFPISPEIKELEYNFRSEKQIVDFNNAFFTFAGRNIRVPAVESLYQKAAQKSFKETNLGKVEIDFQLLSNKDEEMEFFPQKVVETIQARVASKNVAYRDFCVLVRKREQGVAIAKALNAAEIPIVSSETLLINNCEHVRFILALLYCLQDENNEEKAYTVFDYLAKQKKLAANETHDFLAKLFQQKKIWEALPKLGYEFSASKCMALPIYDAVEYIIHVFIDIKQIDAYLQFFLDEVFAFANKQAGDIHSLLSYWERVKDKKSISAPEGENAVQIMTIHKSKGLQFPIVILPFITQKMDDTGLEKFWIPTQNPTMPFELASGKSSIFAEMEGEVAEIFKNLKQNTIFNAINLLYVAMTRAERELYIFTKYNEKKEGTSFDKNSYPELFYHYLQSIGQWEEGKFNYQFGSNFPFEEKLEETKNTYSLQFQPSNRSLGVVTNADFLWNDQLQAALLKGNRIHAIMAGISIKEDINLALKKAIQQEKILAEEETMYREELYQIIEHTELSPYFEKTWKSLNEQEIAFNQRVYRPDRICIQNKDAVVIDYKTGAPNLNHQLQIMDYKKAVEGLSYTVQKCFLVYLNHVVEVVEV